jgi:hypothetical protein
MFSIAARPPQVPTPAAIVLDDAFPFEEYVAVATRVGVVNAALKQEMIRRVCAARGLRLFDVVAVRAYLDAQFGDVPWGWKPLRTDDVGKLVAGHDRPNGQIQQRRYNGAVPLPVLLTVEAIAAAVPRVCFYVSDRADSQTDPEDPFLLVAASGMDDLIVERWDEPNFIG